MSFAPQPAPQASQTRPPRAARRRSRHIVESDGSDVDYDSDGYAPPGMSAPIKRGREHASRDDSDSRAAALDPITDLQLSAAGDASSPGLAGPGGGVDGGPAEPEALSMSVPSGAASNDDHVNDCDALQYARLLAGMRPWCGLATDSSDSDKQRSAIVRATVDFLHPDAPQGGVSGVFGASSGKTFVAAAMMAVERANIAARWYGMEPVTVDVRTVAKWLKRCFQAGTTSKVPLFLAEAAAKREAAKCPIRSGGAVRALFRDFVDLCTPKAAAVYKGHSSLPLSEAHAILKAAWNKLQAGESTAGDAAPAAASAAMASSTALMSPASAADATGAPLTAAPVDADTALLREVVGDDGAELDDALSRRLQHAVVSSWGGGQPANVIQAAELAAIRLAVALHDHSFSMPSLSTFSGWVFRAGFEWRNKSKNSAYNCAHERADVAKMRSDWLDRRSRLVASPPHAGPSPRSGRVFLIDVDKLDSTALDHLRSLVFGPKAKDDRVSIIDAAPILTEEQKRSYDPEFDRIAITVYHDEAIIRADTSPRKTLVRASGAAVQPAMPKGISPGVMVSGFISPSTGTLAFEVVETK